ncbi:MAG: thioredoxin domain-containing protein [Candidatus Nitrosotenuis sp.]
MTIEVGSNEWHDKVLASKTPVIVDFWASWCPWCMKLIPVFEEVSKTYEGKLSFAKVDVEKYPDIAKANGVMGIPVMKMFCGGRNVGEIVGYMNKEKLVHELDKMLSTVRECLTQSSVLTKETATK